MIGLCVLLVLATFAYADNVKDAEQELSTVFKEQNDINDDCNMIEGDLDSGDCYNCYNCDHYLVKIFKGPTKLIKFRSSDCKNVTNVCCIPYSASVVRSADSCGSKVEINKLTYKGTRTSVRSVLIEEYPWRAWVYAKKRGELLCAGTVVDANTRVVMTSASCVRGYQARDLAVGFTRDSSDAISLKSIEMYSSYDSSNYVNDIALLILRKDKESPHWVRPVCVPTSPPLKSTTCISISDDDFFVTALVLSPTACQAFNIKSELGQMCAAAPLSDYKPERGSTLLCQDELRTQTDLYFATGIALHTNDTITAYTDVYKFEKWIRETIAKNLYS